MPQGDAIWSETLAQYQTHAGVDILSDAGEAVLAALPGTVADTGIDPLLGFYVHLSHEDGVSTRYACLQARDRPEAGKSVAAGDVIGYVGNPGLSECVLPPHLHFEAYADGVWSDLFPGLS